MSKIWYCFSCGYEVTSRGRCHRCKEKFLASPLPELVAGDEDDEVGYRLADWEDATRGRLIHALVRHGVAHRFEDDELVVRVDDEAEVDELVAAAVDAPSTSVGSGPSGGTAGDGDAISDGTGGGPGAQDGDVVVDDVRLAEVEAQLVRLRVAAGRLEADPTDMEADGDVAEASAAVFVTDELPGMDAQVWAAVGRTTRRLLGSLGSDEAEEDEIARQSGILAVLLGDAELGGGSDMVTAAEDPGADGGVDGDVGTGAGERGSDETVYELPEWLPEQRAELTGLLTRAGIHSTWDRGDLVVPADRESEVEALFDGIHGVADSEASDEAQYHEIEELFAATSRLVGDPDDPSKAADFLRAVPAVEGSPPLGFDGISWSAIRKRGRVLADCIEHKANPDVIVEQSSALRDLLRALV